MNPPAFAGAPMVTGGAARLSLDGPETIARDLAAVRQLDAIPVLLDVLCDSTGMRFAAVARVTDSRWIACAVRDDIDAGLAPGGEFDAASTLCLQSRATRAPVVIESASTDPRFSTQETPRLFDFESYVSVPIVLPGGRYFGNLCAIDPEPAALGPRVLATFAQFARLIGRQIERELLLLQNQTALRDERAAGELREQFIAILGHDLRNPLHAIFATAELLQRRLTEPALGAMAMRITGNARRMSGLIDDVLDFARGRLGGGIGVDPRAVEDIAADLMAVVEELQDANPQRRLQTDIRLPARIECDPARIQQMASNLVANALTHGAADSAVRIAASADEEHWYFSVWNAGAPIPPAGIAQVFEPFWRNTVSTSRQGLGLGLYICSQIVDAHHGTLGVTSTLEDGTQFIARLPLRAAARGG